jgi:hypothetical protein
MKSTEEENLHQTKQDKIIEEQDGGLNFKLHETSITWKIPHHNSIKIIGQAQEGVLIQYKEEEDL